MIRSIFYVVAALLLASHANAELELAWSKRYSLTLGTRYGDNLDGWTFGGSAFRLGSFVRVTADKQSQKGYIWTRSPLDQVGNEWEVDMQFRISGKGVSLFGDGLAFWYTQEQYHEGDVFGHYRKFTGLGVFFDTYDNAAGRHTHKHPYVSLMVNDGSLEYSHDKSGTHTTLHSDAGCHARIRQFGYEDKIVTARMTYTNRKLAIKLAFGKMWDYETKAEHLWTKCLEVSDIDLPPGYFMGVSGSTGDLSDAHDVISLTVRHQKGATAAQVPQEVYEAQNRERPTDNVEEFITPHPEQEIVPEDDEAPSTAESSSQAIANSIMERLEVEGTEIVKILQEQGKESLTLVNDIREQLRSRVTEMGAHLEGLLKTVRDNERELEQRLARLEDTVAVRIAEMESSSTFNSKIWILPFAFLLLLVIVGGLVTRNWWQKYKRTHFL